MIGNCSLFFDTFAANAHPEHPLNIFDMGGITDLWNRNSVALFQRVVQHTWQCGEKARLTQAGSTISGGHGGSPGMRSREVFQTDLDDLFMRSRLSAFVVRDNLSRS